MDTASTNNSGGLPAEYEVFRLLWARHCTAIARTLPHEPLSTGDSGQAAHLVVSGARELMVRSLARHPAKEG